MPASISTHLDEQEFLELADCYYDTPPSHTASTTTLSTTHYTHLRRRATTPGPRWRPSTLIEFEDSGRETNDGIIPLLYDTLEGQTTIVDPRVRLLTASTSISLDLDSDATQSFAKERDLTANGTLRPQRQIPQIDPSARSSLSATKAPRPISTASLVPGSCFRIASFRRWNMKGFYQSSNLRPRKEKKVKAVQLQTAGKHGTGERIDSRRNASLISLDSSQLNVEYSMPQASRGLSSVNSLFVGLDYDYHLAVEILINKSSIDPRSIS